ncbi:MAG TPA: hypothetical protein VFB96_06905 [Pirellulaceae bacterium]|nr:hypothetical protein [Pirellulaceae bacterium]
MDWQRQWIACLVASAAAILLPSARAQEPSVLKRRPVVISITDEPPLGKSPYADWPDRGMRSPPVRAQQAEEIFPEQAAAIAATYGQEPWRIDDHECAGWPANVHGRAHPSDTGRYCGYYVGGGAAWHGEGRYAHEGTWGWDYHGFILPKRVALLWWHGHLQSGTGAYATDGPKVIHHE